MTDDGMARAKRAITAIFDDATVPLDVTRERLEELKEDIDALLARIEDERVTS
ncbi:hypothetical protein [Paracoccus sp. PAR01]|uniref:hypothetical protein n=1 Tax=Paracoccus TaxID=265 RepID=UPI0017827F33|nr:hypothetical protein [Paracoccus sp. PAR01]MBD9528938.1 hypothetical protein [Paracoccus sp. PAR01]